MNKWQKMFGFVLIVCLVLMIYGIIIPKHCSGEDYFKDHTIKPEENLISDYNLIDTDKIIIETRKDGIGFQPYQHIIITNQDTINSIIAELKDNKYDQGILLAFDYVVSFCKGDKELLVLGLSIDLDKPKSSFLRHRTHDYTHDYYISRTLYDFLVSALHLEDGS